MNIFRKIWPVVLLLLGVSCTYLMPIRVVSQKDPNLELSQFKTFAWMSEDFIEDATMNPTDVVLADRIHRGIEDQLGKKGYRKTRAASADLLVNYFISFERRTTFQTKGPDYEDIRLWQDGSGEPMPEGYRKGTLILDLIEAKGKKLVWRGMAQAGLHHSYGRYQKIERIQQALEKLFEEFPLR